MRTAIRIDEQLWREAKQMAVRQGKSLTTMAYSPALIWIIQLVYWK